MAKINKDVWLARQVNGDREIRVVHKRDVNEQWKILAGPVTVTFDVPNACPHCGAALREAVEPAKAESLPFVVEVGGKYRTLGGGIAHIFEYDGPQSTYCFRGFVNGRESCWTETGKWYVGEATDDDLVERIS